MSGTTDLLCVVGDIHGTVLGRVGTVLVVMVVLAIILGLLLSLDSAVTALKRRVERLEKGREMKCE